jgi:predicted nucleotidyltransferase
MKREEGIRLARRFKKLLLERGYPIQRVILFGSVAKNTTHQWSDIDIAVVTNPFNASRIEEGTDILLASMDIDTRIETVTLRPEDFKRPFFGLGKELEKTGVDV